MATLRTLNEENPPDRARRTSQCRLLCRKPMIIDSDETLVGRAQHGEHAAFEELVRRTSRLIYARLYLETGDAHQAEDLLQETLLTAYRTIRQLAEPAKFRAWLLRIA